MKSGDLDTPAAVKAPSNVFGSSLRSPILWFRSRRNKRLGRTRRILLSSQSLASCLETCQGELYPDRLWSGHIRRKPCCMTNPAPPGQTSTRLPGPAAGLEVT